MRSRNQNGVVKQPTVESVLIYRRIDQVPHREGGNERLAKHNQFGTGINSFLNHGLQLLDRWRRGRNTGAACTAAARNLG